MQEYIAALQELMAQHAKGEITDSVLVSKSVILASKYKVKALHSTTDRPLPSRMGVARKTSRTIQSPGRGLH